MLKKLISLFKSSRKETNFNSDNFIRIQLNDKIMPINRGDVYEDPIDKFLKKNEIGEVTGGGTLQLKSGEIAYCDVEIYLKSKLIDKSILKQIIEQFEDFGAPKGSKLIVESTGEEIEFGKLEGIGIYLDGINLPEHVYAEADIDYLADEFNKRTSPNSDVVRNWTGNEESALYYYSSSFLEMKDAIQDVLDSYPLCKGARIVQVA